MSRTRKPAAPVVGSMEAFARAHGLSDEMILMAAAADAKAAVPAAIPAARKPAAKPVVAPVPAATTDPTAGNPLTGSAKYKPVASSQWVKGQLTADGFTIVWPHSYYALCKKASPTGGWQWVAKMSDGASIDATGLYDAEDKARAYGRAHGLIKRAVPPKATPTPEPTPEPTPTKPARKPRAPRKATEPTPEPTPAKVTPQTVNVRRRARKIA
jgi:hypothetical protein